MPTRIAPHTHAGHQPYWRQREQAARAMAAQAIDPCVARLHVELADRYAASAAVEDASERTAMDVADGRLWRTERADQFSVIVDAERYFEVAREVLLQARSRIMLIGWDFDARIRLSGDERGPGEPATVGEFLYWLVERTPTLELYLLRWDVGAIKALFRGSTIFTVMKWMRHPRIHTKLDGHHPTGSSHHQKLVSVDDRFAICGGIDMTSSRWDTRAHRDDDPGRRTPNGKPYKPWHDATTAIAGTAAVALAELCRTRWRIATGKHLEPVLGVTQHWPASLKPDLEGVELGIARTIPKMDDQEEVREVERLFLTQIARAKRQVYVETQYFASRTIAQAIAARLQEEDGPEFVIINPTTAEGWLQAQVMDSARARLMQALRRLDRRGRLAMYHPFTAAGEPIYVHAKIMVVDGASIRVGSANFNNRSMGLDSECDVLIEGGEGVAAVAAELRDALLAEHLGVEPDAVAAAIKRDGLIGAVEALRGHGRSLRPYEVPDLGSTAEWLADSELLDPEGAEEVFEPLSQRGLFRRKKVRGR